MVTISLYLSNPMMTTFGPSITGVEVGAGVGVEVGTGVSVGTGVEVGIGVEVG
jgi:hypothetical protein